MDNKNSQSRLNESSKTQGSPAGDRASMLRQSVLGVNAEGLTTLRAELNRALDESRLGHFEIARNMLQKILDCLDAYNKNPAALEDGVRDKVALLSAATRSVMGRVYEHLGEPAEAERMFRQATSTFDQLLFKPDGPAALSQDYREYGVALLKLHRVDEAVRALRRSVESDLIHPETLRYLGIALKGAGDYDEASKYLLQALEYLPDDQLALTTLAEIFEERGQTDEAAQTYLRAALTLQSSEQVDKLSELLERSLALSPRDTQALKVKAEALRLTERNEEALEAIDRALELDPGDAFSHGTRGQILRALGRNEEAVEALRRCVEEDPRLGWAYAELGEVLRLLGRNEEALVAIDRALELMPDDQLALGAKGAILQDSGRYEEAVETLDRLLSIDPDDQFALAYKGEALRLLGRKEEALEAIDRALELDPGDAFSHGTRGQILRALGRNEEAVEALRRCVEEDPRLGWAYAELGEVLRLLGRNEEALVAIDRALQLDPNNGLIIGSKGAVQHAMGLYEEALRSFNESLKILGDYPWTVAMKASVLCEVAEFHRALEMLERIDEETPKYIRRFALSLKGWALENLGPECAEAARQAYEAAIDLDSTHLWSHKGLANILYMMGDLAGALNRYEWIITEALKCSEVDANSLALRGWCHFRVGNHDEAMRRYVDALSLNPRLVGVQFDLALASMVSRRYGLALREYERGLELTRHEHRLRQRGILHVALDDCRLALKAYPELDGVEDYRTIISKLEEAYEKVKDLNVKID